jgi:hypothetical protein
VGTPARKQLPKAAAASSTPTTAPERAMAPKFKKTLENSLNQLPFPKELSQYLQVLSKMHRVS